MSGLKGNTGGVDTEEEEEEPKMGKGEEDVTAVSEAGPEPESLPP